tara:strand:+ start:1362 stop:2462 length:1101 start_codon:yes stop_codon:yes gene_type:complete
MKQLPKKPEQISEDLVQWFRQNARELPWRHNRTAYRVWLSEIMLQQTQVATAIAYYEKFITRFPKVEDLAQAPLDEVLGMWSGLGYYSRARNLHKTATIITNDLNGVFPKTEKGLRALPGVGPYTAGAITTLAYNQPSKMVDGNIARVFTRLSAESIVVDSSAGKIWLEEQTHACLQAYPQPRLVGEGLMELGALVCHPKNPLCEACPFAAYCRARKQKTTFLFPQKKPKTKVKRMHQMALVVETPRSILLVKQPPKGLFGGMYTLPIQALSQAPTQGERRSFLNTLKLPGTDVQWFENPVIRKLTHRELYFYCGYVRIPRQVPLPGHWMPINKLGEMGISTAMVAAMCAASPHLSQNFGKRAPKP